MSRLVESISYMNHKSHEIVSYSDQLTLNKLISCSSRSDVENWKNKVNGRLEDTKSRPGRVTRDTWSRYYVCEQFVADYGKLQGNKNRSFMAWLDVTYFFRVCECRSEIRKILETMAKVSQACKTCLDRTPSLNRCGR